MWYFAWMLGVGFAVLLAIMNAMWGENEAARAAASDDGADDARSADVMLSSSHVSEHVRREAGLGNQP